MLLVPSKSSDREGLSTSDTCRFFIQNPAFARGIKLTSMRESYQKDDADGNAVLQYIQITGEVLCIKGLSSFAKLVFGVIYTRENGGEGRPNPKLIAQDMGVTVREVQMAIDELDEFEIL